MRAFIWTMDLAGVGADPIIPFVVETGAWTQGQRNNDHHGDPGSLLVKWCGMPQVI